MFWNLYNCYVNGLYSITTLKYWLTKVELSLYLPFIGYYIVLPYLSFLSVTLFVFLELVSQIYIIKSALSHLKCTLTTVLEEAHIDDNQLKVLMFARLGCFSVEWFWWRSTSHRPLAQNGSRPWESPLSNAQLLSASSGSGWWVEDQEQPSLTYLQNHWLDSHLSDF